MAAPNIQPSADYVVGPIVDAIDINGDPVKVVAPGFVQLGTDGEPVSGGSAEITGPLDGNGNVLVSDTQSALVATAMGSITDAAWDGVTAGATVISLLKKIALNTTPAP